MHSMVDFPSKPLFFVCFCPPKNATQGKGRTFFLPSSGASCWGMMMYFCCSQKKLRDSPCQLVLGISGSSKEGKKMESGMPEKFKLTIPLTKHRVRIGLAHRPFLTQPQAPTLTNTQHFKTTSQNINSKPNISKQHPKTSIQNSTFQNNNPRTKN